MLRIAYQRFIPCTSLAFFSSILFEGGIPLQNMRYNASNNESDFRAICFPDSSRVLETRCIQDSALFVRDSQELPDPYGMISVHGLAKRAVQRLLENCLSPSGDAVHQPSHCPSNPEPNAKSIYVKEDHENQVASCRRWQRFGPLG